MSRNTVRTLTLEVFWLEESRRFGIHLSDVEHGQVVHDASEVTPRRYGVEAALTVSSGLLWHYLTTMSGERVD
jgi:hypothetical protein